ncbi:FRG domain-containing protein [Bdellovibrio sp. HCB-110]|uniref:FRG domain-containing protein n=1 Tax=Bdellovibrio sp. HCB-110 TaxID=3391182 RepID=UPI0039B5745C
MNGQWIGSYAGSSAGSIILNLDDRGTHFEGHAYAFEENNERPSTYASIITPGKGQMLEFEALILPIDPISGDLVDWKDIAHLYPGTIFGKKVAIKLEYKNSVLEFEWRTDIGSNGIATLHKSESDKPTEYSPIAEVQTWDQFKSFVSSLEYRRFIFRGQEEAKRLRTSFHRTGRADLFFYINNDIPALYRHLSQRTKFIFNLDIPDQNGAFMNLAQHHGYPTPLLDWSYSPFVSAYFAYKNIKSSHADQAGDDQKVRIFMFDQKSWRKEYNQLKKLSSWPHFSLLEFIAIENERMIPQQSISSVTNLDDIETYIRAKEKEKGQQFLKIIDLPLKERTRVMRELAVMGITAGSLFPGLDGACEEIRERFFRT